MAQPKRDYTIENLGNVAHVHLNVMDGELMGKLLKIEGVYRCVAMPASSLFAVNFSPNYDVAELTGELETLLADHFAPGNPVPGGFADAFDDDESLKP